MAKLTVWWSSNLREGSYSVETPEEAVQLLDRLANEDLKNRAVKWNAGGLLDADGDEWYSDKGDTDGMDINEYGEWLKEQKPTPPTIAAPAEAPAPEAASAAVADAVTPEDIFTPDVFGTSSPEHLEAILERNALRAEVATLKAQLAAARAALEWIADWRNYHIEVYQLGDYLSANIDPITNHANLALKELNK